MIIEQRYNNNKNHAKLFSYLCIVKKEMELFEAEFAKVMSCETLPMDKVVRYVSGSKGKRLRPLLVFQTAKLLGEINDATRRTALFVELVHTATLIHDDVVDGSDTRRGQPSVNKRWDNMTAVLAGDFLLSKAMLLLSDSADHQILVEMLETALAMSEGELMQLRGESLEMRSESEAVQDYLDIITRKTARLIRACCVGGALSVGAPQALIDKVGDFGLNLGLVFQMRDDTLDDDNPAITAMAKRLLPMFLDKAMKSLSVLEPMAKNVAALEELRALTLFCAERVV